ncbi:hypothetical protein VHEMI02136 [[Torrubiella] hemipterigena]|uniref:J domain-containing protein n=1 Tax=[Torrubiella] hemipterigena TaxID=1531966 RepID=A0A0A1T9K4_9HYPO|nr:hypothetical protein VHEMI02136 [[Torrubiella] hemipterigena]
MILQRSIRAFPAFSLHSQSRSKYKKASNRHHASIYRSIHSWPCVANPTPYQVLGLSRDAPYNKKAFNSLVKLYHPDLHQNQQESERDPSSTQIRLQRYYLVVAAHELLSCPAKRLQYDRHNIGWKYPAMQSNSSSGRRTGRYQQASHEPPHDAYSPRGPQKPIYMSNGFFAILVLSVVMANGVIQHERAKRSASKHKSQVYWIHENIVNSLAQSLQLNASKSRDRRILEFLCRQYIATKKSDNRILGLMDEEDWENNICRH